MVNKFLCCLNLKNGVLFIGVANLVTSVLVILAAIPSSVVVSILFLQLEKGKNYEKDYTILTWKIGMISVATVISVLYLVAASLLIYGVTTKKPGLLRPWTNLAAFTILLHFACIAIGFAIAPFGFVRAALVLCGFCPLPFACYFYICVLSYRKHMLDEEENLAAKPDEARSTLVG